MLCIEKGKLYFIYPSTPLIFYTFIHFFTTMSAPPNTTRQRSNYAAKVEDEPEQSQKTENPYVI